MSEQGGYVAELAFSFEACGPVCGFAQGFDIGDDPGKAVGGMLVGGKRRAINLAVGGESFAKTSLSGRFEGVQSGDRLA